MKKLRLLKDLTVKELKKIDEFILDEKTNGEFINSYKYLSYHKNRFEEDSIAVFDDGAGTIDGVLMGVVDKAENRFISHAGTTFSGPVINTRESIGEKEDILNIMLDYYEKKYGRIELKVPPSIYYYQPEDTVNYFLLRRGYECGMTALANVLNISAVEKPEDALQLFNGGKRNHLRKALKEGNFYFREDKNVSLDIWNCMDLNLHQKFSSRTTHSFDEICELRENFRERILPFSVYTADDVYGAFSLVYCFKNVFHTQYLDVNYEISDKYPNLFLIYHLIWIAKKMGYTYFSFGSSTENGGNVINYGLYNYKNGFGGGNIMLPFYYKKFGQTQT